MEVLRVLNVAPTQLHPNSWAALQAFRLLCEVLGLKPTPRSFLHFFGTRPRDRIGWVSLVSQSKNSFLHPFTTSYKKFKKGFFKVVIEEEGRPFFCDGKTLPFYWTKDPTCFYMWPRSLMTEDDLEVLSVLDGLPRQIPTRAIVCAYLSSNKIVDVDGMFLLLVSALFYFDI